MAKSARQKAFEGEFRQHIEQHRAALVKALRRVVSTKPPAKVKILSFEIFSDWSSFPVNAFALDDEAPNEVYFEAPFSGFVLPGKRPLIPNDSIDEDAYENAGVDTFAVGARVLAEWFGECWHEVGVDAFPLPAYIGHHDRSAQYDLRKRRWTDASLNWPE